MYCSKCGAANAQGAAFCTACGQPAGVAPAIPATPSVPSYVPPPVAPSPYAGFWLRLVAHLIDGAVMMIGFGLVVALVIAFVGLGFIRGVAGGMNNPDVLLSVAVIGAIFLLIVALTAVTWLYYAWMESSQYQGTLGKMALGLIVTDMRGGPVSFARATGRFFAKIVTGMIPLAMGYIMAGFTEKKQALHDMIASCLVLRKS